MYAHGSRRLSRMTAIGMPRPFESARACASAARGLGLAPNLCSNQNPGMPRTSGSSSPSRVCHPRRMSSASSGNVARSSAASMRSPRFPFSLCDLPTESPSGCSVFLPPRTFGSRPFHTVIPRLLHPSDRRLRYRCKRLSADHELLTCITTHENLVIPHLRHREIQLKNTHHNLPSRAAIGPSTARPSRSDPPRRSGDVSRGAS